MLKIDDKVNTFELVKNAIENEAGFTKILYETAKCLTSNNSHKRNNVNALIMFNVLTEEFEMKTSYAKPTPINIIPINWNLSLGKKNKTAFEKELMFEYVGYKELSDYNPSPELYKLFLKKIKPLAYKALKKYSSDIMLDNYEGASIYDADYREQTDFAFGSPVYRISNDVVRLFLNNEIKNIDDEKESIIVDSMKESANSIYKYNDTFRSLLVNTDAYSDKYIKTAMKVYQVLFAHKLKDTFSNEFVNLLPDELLKRVDTDDYNKEIYRRMQQTALKAYEKIVSDDDFNKRADSIFLNNGYDLSEFNVNIKTVSGAYIRCNEEAILKYIERGASIHIESIDIDNYELDSENADLAKLDLLFKTANSLISVANATNANFNTEYKQSVDKIAMMAKEIKSSKLLPDSIVSKYTELLSWK